MLLIPCPHCGERAQVEFAYGGDATKRRPPDGAPDEAWYDYVYLRGNPRGPHEEWWLHHAGCGRWIRVTRDTATHEVLGAAPAAPPSSPEPESGGGSSGAPEETRERTGLASPEEPAAPVSPEGAETGGTSPDRPRGEEGAHPSSVSDSDSDARARSGSGPGTGGSAASPLLRSGEGRE